MRTSTIHAATLLSVGLMLSIHLPSHAQVITYLGVIDNAGPAATTSYSAGGYDLYSTTPAGTTSGGVSGNPFGYGTRITSFPAYVSSVAANGANLSAGGFNYATINNPLGGQVEAGFLLRTDPINAERNLLDVVLGPFVPATFFFGLLEDTGGFAGDYPEALRMVSLSGGNSGLITTIGDRSTGVDLYFFQVTGAVPGDRLTISGREDTIHPDGTYHTVLAGLTFSPTNPIPEPGSLVLCGVGVLCWAVRRYRRTTTIPNEGLPQ